MLTSDQKTFIKDVVGLRCDFDHMTDDDILQVDEAVADYLCTKGLGIDCEPTPAGRVCEDILNAIANA